MVKRSSLGLFFLLASAIGFGQVPQIAIFVDAYPTLIWREGNAGNLRWYSLDGRTSTVGFNILLESGNRVLVSQRLQRFPGDADDEQLDEYWIESTGSWRVGKQLLPFGSRNLIRETGMGARLDTRLLIHDLPIQVAYVDNGSGRSRGVIGRIGRRAGVSFAVGDNFGNQATDFSSLQIPSAALGKGRGFSTVIGFDFSMPIGSFTLHGEGVTCRGSNNVVDGDRTVSDLWLNWFLPGSANSIGAGWARRWDNDEAYLRMFGDFKIAEKVTLRPYIRFDTGGLRDIAITTRVKF